MRQPGGSPCLAALLTQDPALETLPSEEEMLTISLELGLDLWPTAAAVPVAAEAAGICAQALQPASCRQTPRQLQERSLQQPAEPRQLWETACVPALLPTNTLAADVPQLGDSLWALRQRSPTAGGLLHAPLVSPFATSRNTSWVIASPVGELLCATPVQLRPPRAPASMPPTQPPAALQLAAQLPL